MTTRMAHIMAGAPSGGAELFFERLTIALAGAGETVLPVIRRDPARAARLTAGGLAPVQFAFGGPFDLFTGRGLRQALRRFAPRVAVAWMRRAAHHAPAGDWALVGRLGGYYDLDAFRRCDHLVANTRGLGAWIARQGWSRARIHVLPNFAPDLSAPPDPAASRRLRAALGIPDDARVILALGRLHPNKAFDVLVAALARLPGVHAVIAGEGAARPALETLAARAGVAGRLRMPGWRTDQAALLAACDALICPSRQEPLGNVVLEAWSARRPVIACAAEGPSELIAPGVDGLVAPVDDAAALADCIASVLGDAALAARLAQAGRARFEASFAPAPVLDAWRAFLARVEHA